jgi:hypothetical protein
MLRHAKEIEAVQQQIGQAEQKTTDNPWVTVGPFRPIYAQQSPNHQFSELQSTHEKEMSDARVEQSRVVDGLKAKIDE